MSPAALFTVTSASGLKRSCASIAPAGRPMNITGSLRMRADSQKGSRDTENDDGMWATNCYKWLELPDRFPDTIGRRKDSLPGDSLWSDVSHQRGYAR